MMAQIGKLEAEQCHFTIFLDTKKIPFAMTHFLETLERTKYRTEIPEFEKKIDNKEYCTANGKALSGQALCIRLRNIFLSFEVLKAKMEMVKKDMFARTVLQDLLSQGAEGRMSIGTLGTQGSRETRHNQQTRTPPLTLGRSNLALLSRKKKKEVAIQKQVLGEANFASAVTYIPEVHDLQRLHDYKASIEAYKNY